MLGTLGAFDWVALALVSTLWAGAGCPAGRAPQPLEAWLLESFVVRL